MHNWFRLINKFSYLLTPPVLPGLIKQESEGRVD